jgi:hypothetical protein
MYYVCRERHWERLLAFCENNGAADGELASARSEAGPDLFCCDQWLTDGTNPQGAHQAQWHLSLRRMPNDSGRSLISAPKAGYMTTVVIYG